MTLEKSKATRNNTHLNDRIILRTILTNDKVIVAPQLQGSLLIVTRSLNIQKRISTLNDTIRTGFRNRNFQLIRYHYYNYNIFLGSMLQVIS